MAGSVMGFPDEISQMGHQRNGDATFFSFPRFSVSLIVFRGVAMSRMEFVRGHCWQPVSGRHVMGGGGYQ